MVSLLKMLFFTFVFNYFQLDPTLLQSLDISCAPKLVQMFLMDPDPVQSSLVFELTRFFNMMSRNRMFF